VGLGSIHGIMRIVNFFWEVKAPEMSAVMMNKPPYQCICAAPSSPFLLSRIDSCLAPNPPIEYNIDRTAPTPVPPPNSSIQTSLGDLGFSLIDTPHQAFQAKAYNTISHSILMPYINLAKLTKLSRNCCTGVQVEDSIFCAGFDRVA
jgi:hypothetical protein